MRVHALVLAAEKYHVALWLYVHNLHAVSSRVCQQNWRRKIVRVVLEDREEASKPASTTKQSQNALARAYLVWKGDREGRCDP